MLNILVKYRTYKNLSFIEHSSIYFTQGTLLLEERPCDVHVHVCVYGHYWPADHVVLSLLGRGEVMGLSDWFTARPPSPHADYRQTH